MHTLGFNDVTCRRLLPNLRKLSVPPPPFSLVKDRLDTFTAELVVLEEFMFYKPTKGATRRKEKKKHPKLESHKLLLRRGIESKTEEGVRRCLW